MDYLTKHFLVLSTLAIAAASGISMLFLAAYLTVFDWSLIWLIEYTDMAKLFLIGTALAGSVLATTLNQLWDVIAWIKHQISWAKWGLLVGLALLVVGTTYSLYNDIKTENGHAMYHCFRALSTLFLIMIFYFTVRDIDKWRNPTALAVVNNLSTLVFALGTFGATFGYYVRDVRTDLSQIHTKTASYDNAKVIIWLSHHLAFVSDGKVIVVPTGDLVEVTSKVNPV